MSNTFEFSHPRAAIYLAAQLRKTGYLQCVTQVRLHFSPLCGTKYYLGYSDDDSEFFNVHDQWCSLFFSRYFVDQDDLKVQGRSGLRCILPSLQVLSVEFDGAYCLDKGALLSEAAISFLWVFANSVYVRQARISFAWCYDHDELRVLARELEEMIQRRERPPMRIDHLLSLIGWTNDGSSWCRVPRRRPWGYSNNGW